uniref:Molybdopterin biosynthesis protein n=1 Tax=Polysiphonia elongata TaxID=159753 RepID=A0A1Z1MCC4_9FLOR|nr:Molybdopterin biosynthesis protein [Polysiphonia elongata]ARW63404.1 Molybdopterin biosynthesis protein [Polysiphonia elongata]
MQNQLSKKEIKLYKKQINLEKIGLEGQKKIKKSKILVIGAGGLGCPVLIYLVSSGIGCIGIIDGDEVENSNLNRQILYTIKDLAKTKVAAAKTNLNKINKECEIIVHSYKLNKYNQIEVISYYDIVIDATDNFITRYIIDEACYRLNKVYIYGAASKFEGQSGVFHYQDGIRYKNLYELKFKMMENQCNTEGIMGITTGYIGISQAIETLKIILGLSKKSRDYVNIYEMIEMIVKKKEIKTRRNRINNILTNNTEKAKKKSLIFKKTINTKKSLIVDLKDRQEFIDKHVKQAINIPMSKLKLQQTTKLLRKYEKTNNIIIYCKSIHKRQVASILLKQQIIKHKIINSKNENLIE